jgi:hypothetical protein
VKNTIVLFVLLVVLFGTTNGCGHDGDVWKVLPSELPSCVVDIAMLKTEEPLHVFPEYIWRCSNQDETTFYFSAGGNDFLNMVLDEQCNYICAPDGGFSGSGDGRCKDYFYTVDCELIWCRDEDICKYAMPYSQ